MKIGHAVAAAIALALGLAAPVAGAEYPTVLMVGGLDKMIYLPAMLARELGYFKDAGVAVELRSERAGVHAADELLEGAAQGVVGFYDHTIELQAKGKAVISVVQFAQTPGEAVLVAANAVKPIRSIADLEGVAMGVTGLGSSTHFLSQYLLMSSGVKVNQVRFLPVGGGASFIEAMNRGEIAVGMVTEPTISKMIRDLTASVLVDLRTPEGTANALGGLYPGACLYMHTAWVNRHKATVQALVTALVRALHFIQNHSAAEIAALLPDTFFAGDRQAYIRILSGAKVMFTPDGRMPESGPASVLRVMTQVDHAVSARRIDLGKTFTTEFVSAVPKAFPAH